MSWAEFMGNPVDPDLKKDWFNYRKALLPIVNNLTDAQLIKLKKVEDYAWPQQPVCG
jgi:hypothetical protein